MRSIVIGAAILFSCLNYQTGYAQDYRIYTNVSHQQGTTNNDPKIIARTLTIWHAGKVYDYVDGVGELVVYDPLEQRFTIVSGQHQMACTVDFSELRQFLKVARNEAKEYLAELGTSDKPEAFKTAELIAFQLDPKFKVTFNQDNSQLICSGKQMTYTVETLPAPNAEVAKAFQDYTDWTARLNFVLHGKSLMPGPRVKLNEELAKRSLIPAKVTLSLADSEKTKLTAEPKISWELGKYDLSRIGQWKNLVRNGQLKFVSFHDYQRSLLAQYSEN